jgi:hypothetical protein
LFYLPTYSPEYNPVELFWKWLKPKVYGFSAFGGIKELVDRFRKYVWHYNNDRLSALFDLALESTHIFYKYLSNNVYQKTKGERRH